MNTYKLELTAIESACGVTLKQVQEVLLKVSMRSNYVMIPKDTPPALAGAVARCAFAGPVKFRGLNDYGMPIYMAQ